jgi:2-polyprenyl-3-methyl-5-hydroxy-6-metoxy-1,4-benzoquinol methylase
MVAEELRNTSATGFDERIAPEDLANDPYHLPRYLFAANWAPGAGVVDLCCGLGYGANLLSGAGAKNVLGIDISQDVVEAASRKYRSDKVRFIQGDASAAQSLALADLVTCFEGIEHVPSPEGLLANVVACLDDRGTALISTPNGDASPTGHSGNPYHVREFGRREFEELLGLFFGQVRMFFQWSSGDPFDGRPGLTRFLKLAVPISIKRTCRRILRRPAVTASASFAADPDVVRYTHRPLPVSYIDSLPGLRAAQPPIWVAVCTRPKRDG